MIIISVVTLTTKSGYFDTLGVIVPQDQGNNNQQHQGVTVAVEETKHPDETHSEYTYSWNQISNGNKVY